MNYGFALFCFDAEHGMLLIKDVSPVKRKGSGPEVISSFLFSSTLHCKEVQSKAVLITFDVRTIESHYLFHQISAINS